MSQRELVRMDHDEVVAFLEGGSRAHVATLKKDGSPHVVPVAYVLLDQALTFWADRDSQKVVNLRRDPRVAVIVDDGAEFQELRGAQLAGTAELIDDPATSERVANLFCLKVPEEYREMARAHLLQLATERVVVRVVPSAVASWDHRKLAGVRPQDVGH